MLKNCGKLNPKPPSKAVKSYLIAKLFINSTSIHTYES